MLTNKRELGEVKERLNEMNEHLDGTRSSLEELHAQIIPSHFSALGKRLDLLEESERVYTNRFAHVLDALETQADQLRKRSESFKILENAASKRLLEDVRAEVNKKLDGLFTTTQRYRDLESDMTKTQERLQAIEGQIEKFLLISKEIKQADFELGKYARALEKNDKEKLSLMRENEKLRRLIAKERQRR